MKPTRGLPGSWLNNMSKQRRTALISLAFLLVLLGSLVIYQRFAMLSEEIPMPEPTPNIPVQRGTGVEQPPAEAEGVHVASGQAAPSEVRPALTQLSRPVAGPTKIVLKFGQMHQAFGDLRMYTGLAYTARPGDSVLAAGPGTVHTIEENPLDGRLVIIDHGNGLQTRYAGLGTVAVKPGAAVTSGAVLGQVGDPGAAWSEMGTHLQFQVLVRGEPVDPVSYFPN